MGIFLEDSVVATDEGSPRAYYLYARYLPNFPTPQVAPPLRVCLASQLYKFVLKNSPYIKKLSGTNLFPRSRHQCIYQFSKTPAPSRVSNHSLFPTTRCN